MRSSRTFGPINQIHARSHLPHLLLKCIPNPHPFVSSTPRVHRPTWSSYNPTTFRPLQHNHLPFVDYSPNFATSTPSPSSLTTFCLDTTTTPSSPSLTTITLPDSHSLPNLNCLDQPLNARCARFYISKATSFNRSLGALTVFPPRPLPLTTGYLILLLL
jgi:hypothetical protein